MKEVQTELKKEITCVTDASTQVLGTTIRGAVQEIDQKFQNKQVELKKEIIEQIALHRHSYIGFTLPFASSIHNKQDLVS
jgi:hypothetical protein